MAAELPEIVDTPCGGMQVQRHPLVTNRACEFPSVAPAVSGKAHRHAYLAGSRVTDHTNWGPPQVTLCILYLLPYGNMLYNDTHDITVIIL